MTLSLSGVTQYSPEETTFTPLELWLREYGYYLRLVEVMNKIYPILNNNNNLSFYRSKITCFLNSTDQDVRETSNLEGSLRLEKIHKSTEIFGGSESHGIESFHIGSDSEHRSPRDQSHV